MKTLAGRLELLEQKTAPSDGPMIILRRVVTPGQMNTARVLAESEGLQVVRGFAESDADFEARAIDEVLVHQPGRTHHRIILSGSEARP